MTVTEVTIHAGGLISVDGRYADLYVRTESGYEIRRRTDGIPVADKLAHLIGKRIVLEPKKDSQITEADFLKAVEGAV